MSSDECAECGKSFAVMGGPVRAGHYWVCNVCGIHHREKDTQAVSNLFTAEAIAERIVDEHVPDGCMTVHLEEKLEKEIKEQLEVAMARRTSLAKEIAESLTTRGFHATKTYEHGDLIGDVARALDQMIAQDQENKAEIDRLVDVINVGVDLSQLGLFTTVMELNAERHGPEQITTLGSHLVEEFAEYLQARCKVFRYKGSEDFRERNEQMWREFCDILILINAIVYAQNPDDHDIMKRYINDALIKWVNEEKRLKEQRERNNEQT
jgi:hypothetical protein